MYMSRIWEGWGGVVPRCGFSFVGGVSSFFLGHSHGILIISRNPIKAQSIGTLFEQIKFKGGVCGHVQKSEAHALGCRPRGESSR